MAKLEDNNVLGNIILMGKARPVVSMSLSNLDVCVCVHTTYSTTKVRQGKPMCVQSFVRTFCSAQLQTFISFRQCGSCL